MGMVSLVLGLLGGVSALMGVVTTFVTFPEFAELPELFWFVLAGLLLLGCITINTGSRGGEEY